MFFNNYVFKKINSIPNFGETLLWIWGQLIEFRMNSICCKPEREKHFWSGRAKFDWMLQTKQQNRQTGQPQHSVTSYN